MELAEYVLPHGRQSELARSLACFPQLINGWTTGGRTIPEERCPAIEQATMGAVTCEEMRPDIVWHRVRDRSWPHPSGKPMKDVARSAELAAERDAKRKKAVA